MAITVSGTPTENIAAADPQSFSCAGSSSPKAAVVMIGHGTVSTDIVNSVTYGGVTMTRIQSNTDGANEAGRTYLYFLGGEGVNPAGGSQTVSVDRTEATTSVHVVAFTMDADADLEVVDFDGVNDNVANPGVTLQYGGRTCLSVSMDYTGAASPLGAGTSCTAIHTHDFTAFGCTAQQQTTEGASDFLIGHTAGADDVAFSAMAIGQIVVILPPPFLTTLLRTAGRRTGPHAIPRRR